MLQQPAILKALSTKKAYKQHIDKLSKHPLSTEGKWILDNYASWYEEKDKDIDFNVFADYCFAVKHTNLPIEKKELYSVLIENIINADDSVADDIISNWCRTDRVLDINYSIESYLDGNASLDSVNEAIRLAGDLNETSTINSHIKTFENLNYDAVKEGRHDWRLGILNDATGGVGAGDLVIVFGRPNSGKTSFVVSETSYMLKDIPEDKYVVWINNEESADRILLRYISCVTEKPSSAIEVRWKEYCTAYNKKSGKQVIALDKPAITKQEVENLLDNYPPAIVVFNNLDKIIKTGKESMHKELGLLYQWARELAKEKECAVFAVCQCNEQGEGAKNLFQNMLQDSRTDKAGEADIIIGIGRQNEEEVLIDNKVSRFINICKNKLSEGRVAGLRETYGHIVQFSPQTGRYEDNKPEEYV